MSINVQAKAAPRVTSRTADFTSGLRMEILDGSRIPGERVQLDELREKFNVSLSPIREGLSRLVAEGLLVLVGQRGYRVAPVSIEEFIDIKTQRVDMELTALRQSMRLGDENWELRLMGAFQRLRSFEEKHLERRHWLPEEVSSWEERHHAFHEALIDACGSPILMRFCQILHGMGDRYRRVFLKSHQPDRDVAQEHGAMYQATLERNVDLACEILRTHIERTCTNVLDAMRLDVNEANRGDKK